MDAGYKRNTMYSPEKAGAKDAACLPVAYPGGNGADAMPCVP